ncbi:MAG: filamentous hemagglutinin N-terminal domain-containing protein [Cyanobacteria bacterium J06598_1]
MAVPEPGSTERLLPDTSLGENSSTVVRNRNEASITGGITAGGNLFHSFQEFNVDLNQRVYFTPGNSITNVLSRVTGQNPSEILGTLGVVDGSDANLWLINPNGIIFGENASLDMRGAFYATTGSAVSLGEGAFRANASEPSQLLDVVPSTSFFSYLTSESGDIAVRSSFRSRSQASSPTSVTLTGRQLQLERRVGAEAPLSLLAYDSITANAINTDGANLLLETVVGQVEVAGTINTAVNNRVSGGDVSIVSGGDVTTNGIDTSPQVSRDGNVGDGGDISIVTNSGGNVLNQAPLNSSSALDAKDSLVGDSATGGDILIVTNSGGNITNQDRLNARSRSVPGSAGNGGNITLQTLAGGNISNQQGLDTSSTSGVAREAEAGDASEGGDITITAAAGGDIINQEDLAASSRSVFGGSGDGGSITLSTVGEGRIFTSVIRTFSSALGDNNGSIDGSVGAGSGGDIRLMTEAGRIENIGSIDSGSFSRNGNAGAGGNIEILSSAGGDILNRERLQASSFSDEGSTGRAGNIQMSTVADGNITNNGPLTAQALANGEGSASVGRDTAAGGNVTITAERGSIFNRPVTPTTNPEDNSGSINVRSVSRLGEAGNGGDILVRTNSGDIVLNAYLDSKSYSLESGAQDGGSITVSTETGSIASAGDVNTNLVTSAVSNSEVVDESISSGNVSLQAGDRISRLNIFTLSNRGTSGDILIRGSGDLQLEDVRIVTNEETIVGDFDFNTNPRFPSNPFGVNRNPDDPRVVADQPIILIRPESGQAGRVSVVSAGDLSIDNVFVANNANSPKAAGDILIASPNTVRVTNSSFSTNSAAMGAGGDIVIAAGQNVVLNRSQLTTNTEGKGGEAGSIFVAGYYDGLVERLESLENGPENGLTPAAEQFSEIVTSGEPFEILLLSNGSLLLADAAANADGGDIRINANTIVANPDGNSDIIANARGGDGGTISFPDGTTLYGFDLQEGATTNRLRETRSNDISASSQSGQDGIITSDGITTEPIRTEPEALAEDFATSEQLISNSCISGNTASNGPSGRFTIPGAGDLPTTPEDGSVSVYGLGDVQTLPVRRSETPATERLEHENLEAKEDSWELGDPVIEPESVARLADGKIVFGQQCSAS